MLNDLEVQWSRRQVSGGGDKWPLNFVCNEQLDQFDQLTDFSGSFLINGDCNKGGGV